MRLATSKIEPLESRIAPATFTGSGTILTIDLTTANESITLHTDGSTIIATLAGSTVVNGGGTAGIAGFGTGTAAITSASYTAININDTAAGTAVAFSASSGAYPQSFTITLDDAASGNVTFSGGSTFGASFTASTAAGNITTDAASTLTLTGAGSNLSLFAAGHDVLLQGRLTVAGATTLSGLIIRADHPNNDFVGALGLTSPVAGAVFDSNDLILGSAGFDLNGSTRVFTITAAGNITQQSGTGVGLAGSGTLKVESLGGSITLTNSTNTFGGPFDAGTLALSATGANPVTIASSTRAELGDVRMGTGTLTMSALAGITQTPGTTIESDGNIKLTVTLLPGSLDLSNPGNRIAGTVTFAEASGGGGDLTIAKLRNSHPAALAPVLSATGDTDLTIVFDQSGVTLPGYTLAGGTLSVTAAGDITQSGRLSLSGTSTFTLLGDYAVTLTNASNAFAGSVGINAPQSNQLVQIVESNGLTLTNTNLGRGPFSATVTAGNLTISGAFTQEKEAAPMTLTVTAGSSIAFNSSSNRITGNVLMVGPALTTAAFRNADFMADLSQLTFPGTVTSLTVDFANASIVLPALSLTTLNVTANGILQQPDTALTVSGQATFNSRTFPLELGNTGNDFNNVNLGNAGRNDVTLAEVSGFTFTGASNLGSGRLHVTSSGAIGETGTVNQVGLAPFAEISFTSTGGPLSLAGANSLRGPVSVSVSGANTAAVSNTSAVPLIFGQVKTGTGAFAVTAGASGVTQDPTSVLSFGGPVSFITTSGGSVSLLNAGNTFAGAISLGISGDASLRAAGAIQINSGGIAGNLMLRTGGGAADSITQFNGFSVDGDASFDAGDGSVTLTNAANDFSSVAVRSTGSVSIADANALTLGLLRLGSGPLSLTTGGDLKADDFGGIMQASGTGPITLTTPNTNNIDLSDGTNLLRGAVNVVHSQDVTITSLQDLTFVSSSSITGTFGAFSNGTLILPSSLLTVQNLFASSHSIPISADINAFGEINFVGAVSFSGSRNVTAGGDIHFSGDVTVGGALTLTATSHVNLDRGTWSQGSNPLTINGGGVTLAIGDNIGDPAVFKMTSGVISMPNNGEINVSRDGLLSVGSDNAAAETVTLANGSGRLIISGGFGVGFGATNDRLVKTGGGLIALGSTARLVGSGLADAAASPVLVTPNGGITGHFAESVDAEGSPVDFFAGSDIVTPLYDLTHVSVKAGGILAPNGTITGFLPDGDKYTVSSSLGAAAGLVVVEDPGGRLSVVLRNTASSAASTLTIAAGGGGDGRLGIGGIASHMPGSLAINAPAADFRGSITTDGPLSSLKAGDLIGAVATERFLLTSGGPATAKTAITARMLDHTLIQLAGALDKLTAVGVNQDVDLLAQKFGSIKVSGSNGGASSAAPGIVNPGDFRADLTTTAATDGVAVASAQIAGQLAGTWDLRGSVGAVAAASSLDWRLGANSGVNTANLGLLTNVTSLKLGSTTGLILNAGGAVGSLTATLLSDITLTAGSFGTIKVIADPVHRETGAIDSVRLTATGSTGGVALKSLSVAGDVSDSSLAFLDGDVSSISFARNVVNLRLSATDTGSHGNLKTVTGGRWDSTVITARSIGTLKSTGNATAGLLGDVTDSQVTVTGSTGGFGLKTFLATGSVTESVFKVESGNVDSFKVTRELGQTSLALNDPAFGALGTVQAGEWTTGDSVTARNIRAIAAIGAAATASSPALLGGIDGATISTYSDSGTAAAIGSLKVKADFSGSSVKAEHGLGTLTIGRTMIGSAIVADDATAGASNVGRIATLVIGSSDTSALAANTIGSAKFIGFATPEDTFHNFVFGDLFKTDILVHGGSASGIETFTVAHNFTGGSTLLVPAGVKTLTIGGSFGTNSGGASKINLTNPTTPASGFVNSFTAGAIENAVFSAGRAGTIKTTGSAAFGLLGNVNNSTIALETGATGPGGLQALASLSVAGDFSTSVLDAPESVGKIDVRGRITAVSSGSTRIQAAYQGEAHLGSLSAGAWGMAGTSATTDLVTQGVGMIAVKGNPTRGLPGSVDRGFIDILGDANGIGLGTFTATGAVSNTLFRVDGGDVTSFTASRFVSSDLVVGFRFVDADDLLQAPTAANWSATNHKIGVFKTTAVFDAGEVAGSAAFTDSNVVAAVLGSITLSGVNPDAPATPGTAAFGIAFRASAGAGGTVKINGATQPLVAPFASGQFNYLGLAG